MSDDVTTTNRAQWDERTDIHLRSSWYDVDGFRQGRSSLHPLDVELVGNVDGRRLLHLQCHFGLDTLSWARLGAVATGVDFSPRAIEVAKTLSTELSIPAMFHCGNVYDLPKQMVGVYDVIYTSYGVLAWLGDLDKWARVVSHFLHPDGALYVIDDHPMASTLSEIDGELSVTNSYFGSGPHRYTSNASYADGDTPLSQTDSYQWEHSLSELMTALRTVRLTVDAFGEYPYCEWQRFPSLERANDGYFHLPESAPQVPLLFSLRARRH